MAYFEYFPALYYTLDNNKTGQVVQDIFRRIAISEAVKNQNVLYELYSIQDGDTPEILADRFYDDPGLYWVILLCNEILDPRFAWPMDWYRLEKYIERKYPSNLFLAANVSHFFNIGETVSTNDGSARVIHTDGNKLSVINVSGTFAANGANLTGQVGGAVAVLPFTGTVFENGPEAVHHYEYTANGTYVDSITWNSGNQLNMEAVSNRLYEIRNNDSLRDIRILKPEFVPRFLAEFKKAIDQ
jgi:hypothetical protein